MNIDQRLVARLQTQMPVTFCSVWFNSISRLSVCSGLLQPEPTGFSWLPSFSSFLFVTRIDLCSYRYVQNKTWNSCKYFRMRIKRITWSSLDRIWSGQSSVMHIYLFLTGDFSSWTWVFSYLTYVSLIRRKQWYVLRACLFGYSVWLRLHIVY